MQRVNEVLDVEAALAEIENLEHEGEERNAEEHHRRDVAAECFEEELRVNPVFPESRMGVSAGFTSARLTSSRTVGDRFGTFFITASTFARSSGVRFSIVFGFPICTGIRRAQRKNTMLTSRQR